MLKVFQSQKGQQRLEQLKHLLKPISNLRANFRHRDRGNQAGRVKIGSKSHS
jgi:hypothetical protein